MKMTSLSLALLLAASLASANAAIVVWNPVGVIDAPDDLITAGTLVTAVNGGNDGAGAVNVAGIPFTVGPITSAVTGTVSNTGNGAFYAPTTGDAGLDAILDSHTYISGANPDGRGQIDFTGLTIGNIYQLQVLGVGDSRTCCGGREQFIDDGNGNISGALTRNEGEFVVGTFTALNTTESVFVSGDNDPGISGYVLRQIPEPGASLLCGMVGVALLARRRRSH